MTCSCSQRDNRAKNSREQIVIQSKAIDPNDFAEKKEWAKEVLVAETLTEDWPIGKNTQLTDWPNPNYVLWFVKSVLQFLIERDELTLKSYC